MKHFTKFAHLLILSVTVLMISLNSCKKSNKEDNGPYNIAAGTLGATISGTNWQAKSLYAVDSSGRIFIVAGSSATSSSYPVLLVAFPNTTAEGATVNFNIIQQISMQFIEQGPKVYWAEPVFGGSGTLTISKFNKSTKRVEGSFSGVLKSTTVGAAAKTISNGGFAITYH
jgi:hypothetical protein